MGLLPYFLVVRPDGAGHLDRLGHDVRAGSAVDGADGDNQGRVGEPGLSAHDGLKARDDQGRRRDRVHRIPWHAAVSLFPEDGDLRGVAARRGRAHAIRDFAQRPGHDVHGKDSVGFRFLEQTFLEHEFRSPALAAGWSNQARTLLRGLENKHHRAGQVVLQTRQHLRGCHEHGGMRVVPAGVHDRDLLSEIVGRFSGGEGQPLWLLNGKRIHVGAQGDGATRFSALQNADDAGPRHAGANFQIEAAQVIRDELRGPFLLVAELRMLVNVPPPGDQLLFDGRGPLADLRLQGGTICLRLTRQGHQRRHRQRQVRQRS